MSKRIVFKRIKNSSEGEVETMDEILYRITSRFGIDRPEITFLRHNENRTYRVRDAGGSSYLLRIHEPVKESMAGLQHTYDGLLGELEMLEALAGGSSLVVQKPIRNEEGELITVIEHDGKRLNCSLLTWLEGRDVCKEDVQDAGLVQRFGQQIAELHSFYRQYQSMTVENRPAQGIAYLTEMANKIRLGLRLGLFTPADVDVIEQSILLINARLGKIGTSPASWGLIHGDLGMGNVIVSPEGKLHLIDFGFFGPGYYLLDVAMGALIIPAEHRDTFLRGYFGHDDLHERDFALLEGFMLVAIIGYYAFQMGNESVHTWMEERMPRLCANYCIPFLNGERIFYKIT